MKEWTCKVCGYTHPGDEPPESCPRCDAPKSQFISSDNLPESCPDCGDNSRLPRPRNRGWNTLGIMALIVVLIMFLLAVLSCDNSETTVNNAVIKHEIDLNRYLGRWYEVARFDHKFERGLSHCTAEYTLKEEGKIKVVNRGKKNGKWDTAEGKAKTTDTPGLLRVSFFGPFYSDYRILLLDPDYNFALVGSSSSDYLWILSRTPALDPIIRDTILMEAQNRGYDINKLIWVNQD